MKFRKKPIVIDAWKNEERNPAPAWLLNAIAAGTVSPGRHGAQEIRTLEGTMTADMGDWIIRGVKGELYPCKPDIFAQIYEMESKPGPDPASPPSPLTPSEQIAAWRNRDDINRELAAVINRFSLENGSDTPDFILAAFLQRIIDAWDISVRCREVWYGREGPGATQPVARPNDCPTCHGTTVWLGERWACLGCGAHGGMGAAT